MLVEIYNSRIFSDVPFFFCIKRPGCHHYCLLFPLITYIAKPMLCHSPQCYHCLLPLHCLTNFDDFMFFLKQVNVMTSYKEQVMSISEPSFTGQTQFYKSNPLMNDSIKIRATINVRKNISTIGITSVVPDLKKNHKKLLNTCRLLLSFSLKGFLLGPFIFT